MTSLHRHHAKLEFLAAIVLVVFTQVQATAQDVKGDDWSKVTLDGVFHSEGVATADVNQDG